MTLEQYIRRRVEKQRSGEGEFLFDAWVEDGSLKISFIDDDDDDEQGFFIVTGGTVTPVWEDKDSGTDVRN